MNHLLDWISDDRFSQWLKEHGLPAYRGGQVRQWLFGRRASEFSQMTDLPAALRTRLGETFSLWTSKVVEQRTSPDGADKLLLELADGGRIECVLLRDRKSVV